MLAGDVRAALVRGDLVLRGDRASNNIEVRPNADGDLTVFGVDGTTVNGSHDPFVVGAGTRIRDDVRVSLGRGDDVVRFEGVQIGDDVWIRAGSGSDAVGFYESEIGDDLWSLLGSGDDSFSLDSTTVNDDLYAIASRGDDTIGVDGSTILGVTTVSTSRGDDRVAVRDSVHAGRVYVFTSSGDDLVSVTGSRLEGPTRVYTGWGSDDVVIEGSSFTERVFASGGFGADTLDVDDSDFAGGVTTRSFDPGEVTDAAERTDEVFLDLVASGARLGTIAEIAILTPDLSTLVVAVSAADLVDALNGTDTLTVFAPINSAFDALPDGLLDDLLEEPGGALTDILLYHVAPGATDAATLVTLTSVATLNGAEIAVDGTVLNGTTNVILTDIRAKNGLVHVIDQVLIPPA